MAWFRLGVANVSTMGLGFRALGPEPKSSQNSDSSKQPKEELVLTFKKTDAIQRSSYAWVLQEGEA